NFSEDLQTAGVNAATTYELRSADGDDTFGTADDLVYTLSPSGNSRSVSLRVTDGPLQPGRYRFTVHASALLDRFANLLDGNADGTGGDDLLRTFLVALPAGVILESRSNDTLASAMPLPLGEDPAGSGLFTSSSIALGSIDPKSDSDYWSFPAQQGDQLIIDSESLGGSSFYPRFIVYNAAGQGLI